MFLASATSCGKAFHNIIMSHVESTSSFIFVLHVL